MALPTALFALIASFGLASAAVFASIDAQQGSRNDSARKNAIAAADAGAGLALLRLNRFQDLLTDSNRCVGAVGESVPETSPGWCQPVPAQSVGGSTFTYQVSAFVEEGPLTVISVGTSGTVSRRVEVGLVSWNGKEVFADEHLIGEDQIELDGDAEVKTDIGTNGDIVGKGNAYNLCGDARHGTGKVSPPPSCNGQISEGDKELPAIQLPDGIETVNNWNCRLAANCADPSQVDLYTKGEREARTSTNPWDAAKRTINIEQNADLSMGGADYWVCGLFINNGRLIMLNNANIRIYVDTPEHCGLSPGATQVKITGNANIISTGFNPDTGSYAIPKIYVLGSPEWPTNVELTGNSGTNELMLYAPNSTVDIGGSATWIGMIAGKSIRVHGSPKIESNPGIKADDLNLSSLWQRTRYVECSGATAPAPDANC